MAGEYDGPDRRARAPGSVGRRYSDRKGPRHARDVWLFVVTMLVTLALANDRSTTHQVVRNQRGDTQALCAFRNDLQKRVTSGSDFLQKHPHGIPGIPAGTIRVSLTNSQRTLQALKPLICPASP